MKKKNQNLVTRPSKREKLWGVYRIFFKKVKIQKEHKTFILKSWGGFVKIKHFHSPFDNALRVNLMLLKRALKYVAHAETSA